jgi:CheY-like chemotaxis protein
MKKPILLVDDDDSLSTLVIICIKEALPEAVITHVNTAEEALDYIENKGSFTDCDKNPAPAALLLDLRLPGMSGLKLLDRIKGIHDYNAIPVVILTAMESPRDIRTLFQHNANSCIIKPFDLDNMKKVMKSFINYWINFNRLPEKKAR